MDEFSRRGQGSFYVGDADFGKLSSLKGFSSKENDMQEIEISLQALTEIDYRLAYSSEKLVNLHVLYIYLLAQENELEALDSKSNSFEKAMTFDLLSSILDSEVRELDNFMDTQQEEIVDARHKIFSCKHLTEVFVIMDKKLHDSEESAKQFRQQLLELKMQASQLQNWEIQKALNVSENSLLTDVKEKSNDKMVEQRRYILRMLEKSLARELELEKKLAESRKNEELKLKLRYTEQVAFYMEEAAEVVWGRFLEADNASEVLMGISKGIMGRLQLTEFNLNGFMQRENELKSKVQSLTEQLKAKDASIEKLDRCNVEKSIQQNSEVLALREKVKILEEERKAFELRINLAVSENEMNQEQFIEMENFIESLKESTDIAENRAEIAEAKVTQLSETNLELTEELSFLKGSASTAEKKVGSLEKQLRELDIQLQNAKASSEASQEQQNMLYSAIWDMETLIEELKSKVSKAESIKDSAEEQCIVLSESNLELSKELDLQRSKVISLKTSLDQATARKLSTAKEIGTRTKFITNIMSQLSTERERINQQLGALKQENRSLVKKLKEIEIVTTSESCHNGQNTRNESQASNSINGSCTTKSSDEDGTAAASLNKTFQVVEAPEVANTETQVASSTLANKPANWRKLTFLCLPIFISIVCLLFIGQRDFFL